MELHTHKTPTKCALPYTRVLQANAYTLHINVIFFAWRAAPNARVRNVQECHYRTLLMAGGGALNYTFGSKINVFADSRAARIRRLSAYA